MGLFQRKPKTDVAPAPSVSGDLRDVVADLLHTFGRYGFDLPTETAASLETTAERWARAVRTGESPSIADIKLAFRKRRRAEQKHVPKAIADLKRSLLEAIGHITRAAQEDTTTQVQLEQDLTDLQAAIDVDSPDELRRRVRAAVGRITTTLEASRSVQRRRMDEMGVHVEHLQADLHEAQKRSTTDGLTRLYNRAAFDQDLPRIVSFVEMTGQPLSAVMVDIDHFKSVNDSHGHPAGDHVIQQVADALVRAFPRQSDYIGRYGGEEFIVILRDADLNDAERMTSRLLNEVRAMDMVYSDETIHVTCSAGVAEWRHGESGAALVKRADAALYTAKRGGRDRVMVA